MRWKDGRRAVEDRSGGREASAGNPRFRSGGHRSRTEACEEWERVGGLREWSVWKPQGLRPSGTGGARCEVKSLSCFVVCMVCRLRRGVCVAVRSVALRPRGSRSRSQWPSVSESRRAPLEHGTRAHTKRPTSRSNPRTTSLGKPITSGRVQRAPGPDNGRPDRPMVSVGSAYAAACAARVRARGDAADEEVGPDGPAGLGAP